MSKKAFEIELNVKPVSVNEAWQVRGFRKFKSKVYNEFQKKVFEQLDFIKWPHEEDKALDVIVHFFFSNRQSDVDNGIKPLLDTLSTYYKWNDNKVYTIAASKNIVPKGKEGIHVTIYSKELPEMYEQ